MNYTSLKESLKTPASRAFLVSGAFNPPTRAHEDMISKAADFASKNHTHFYVGSSSASQEKEDAPLTHDQKISILSKIHEPLSKKHKGLAFGILPKENAISPFHQITHLIETGGHKDITIGLGSDQMDGPTSLRKQLKSHIKKWGGFLGSDRKKVHKIRLSFKQLGEPRQEGDTTREEELKRIAAGNLTGVKSGKLRKAVASGDIKLAKAMMPLGVNSSEYHELIKSQQEKVKAMPKKKKKKTIKEDYNTWFCAEEFMEYKLENVLELLLEAKPKEEQRRYQNENKRKQRATDEATMQSNPYSGKIMVVRDARDNLMIVDKNSYNPDKHEIVTAPDKMSEGAASKVLDDPDFVNTKTSIKLFGKIEGADDAKEPKEKKQEKQQQEQQPQEQEQQPVVPPRPEPTIKGKDSQFPDSDHSATDMESGIAAAFGQLKGISLEDQVKMGMLGPKEYEKVSTSQTLLSAGVRALRPIVQRLKVRFPDADFEAFHYGRKKDQPLSKFYKDLGAVDNTPKSDILFRDKKTGMIVGASVKSGAAQLCSGNAHGEAQALIMTAMETMVQDKDSNKAKEFTKKINGFLDRLKTLAKSEKTKGGPVGDYQPGGERYLNSSGEVNDKSIEKYDKLHSECKILLRDILTSNPSFRKALIYEALTGARKFDTGKKGVVSPAVPQFIVTTNNDGTETELSEITEEYIDKLAGRGETLGQVNQIQIRFKSSGVAGKENAAKGKDKIYSMRSVFALGTSKPLNEYFKHNAILRELVGDSQNTEEPNIDDVIDFLKNDIDGDPQKWMQFLEVEAESITTNPIDFKTIAEKQYDNVNIIVINGVEVEIPVEKDVDYNDMSDLQNDAEDNQEMEAQQAAESKGKQEINESYISYALKFLAERKKVDKASGRDYKAEYKWQGTTKQKKRRAKRNAARALLTKMGRVHKGDGKDVDHKNHNTHDNSLDNLKVMSAGKNRSKK